MDNQDSKPAAVAMFARQLRLAQDEHDALNAEVVKGKQNTFIRACIRRELVRRRGRLAAPDANQRKLPLKGRARG